MAKAKDPGYYGAIARIEADMDVREIAEELELSVNTVRRWKTEYQEHKRTGNLDQLLSMEDYTIAIAELTKSLPIPPDMLGDKAKELTKGLDSLSRLQEEFQDSARYLNTRLRALAMSAASTGELLDLINGLSILQTAFFNKNTTQVNVQNNYVAPGQSPYSTFLSDKPNV
ncbi:terminase small subunit [Dickeya phage Amaethon]|nr:terminase small subunit [Dickeya phage Amaethon]